ncbi:MULTISPECIES: hypothetical protein [Campylobacter]|uniref:Periplasmic protein n=1 Tax=Campylobacter californiensis TaxID=1032243 RepID=A0ABD4JG68_9BACT|nr:MULTISPECIES: hypothetical protein [unclassified Campylobacter]MBE2985524.1 hypothetical protein [Campylobacter sp. RM12919]MBE2987447.1 hypothetical protein [Campylobacter sp. RM12920]MBE3022553.1 hypothetical protein [Campylobacter sp. 7477a]MBE3609037.1 hypothetical protein [Campylobacter sp. RM12916]
MRTLIILSIFISLLISSQKGIIDMHGGKSQNYSGFSQNTDTKFHFVDKNATRHER